MKNIESINLTASDANKVLYDKSLTEILKNEEESIENGSMILNDAKYLGTILYKKFNHVESGNYARCHFVKAYTINDDKVYILMDHVKCGAYGTQDRRNYVLVVDNCLKKISETTDKQYFLTEDIGNPRGKYDGVPVKHTMNNPHFVKIIGITERDIKLEDNKGGCGELGFL